MGHKKMQCASTDMNNSAAFSFSFFFYFSAGQFETWNIKSSKSIDRMRFLDADSSRFNEQRKE